MCNFGGAVKQADDYEFAILGVPFDDKSSFLKGAAGGPFAIRAASTSASINSFTELGVDLSEETVLVDLGDIEARGNFRKIFSSIEFKILEILEKPAVPIILGGDHSVTYPAVKAVARKFQSLDILHFDAHPDLYEEYQGDPYSHACPFFRILEEGLVENLVQVGIRAATAQHRKQAEKFGVRMVEMKDIQEDMTLNFSNSVYISFDMDALDPAFAPGVSHCEPGGLSSRQVIQIIHALEASIVGLDVVELNPDKDVSGITASAAVKILMEVMGKILEFRKSKAGNK